MADIKSTGSISIENGSIETGGTTAKEVTAEPIAKTFTQSELEAIIDKRLARERKEAEKKIQDAVTEAQKLAKMSADEQLEHEKAEHEKKLAEREQGITRRELRAEALQQLAEKGLPKELAEVLPYSDADSTNSAIIAVEKAFRQAVEIGINDRLKGSPPKIGNTAPGMSEKDKLTAQYNEAMAANKLAEAVALKNKIFKLEQK